MLSFKQFKKNEPLAAYTTLKIGGPAKFLVEVTSEKELKESWLLAKNSGLAWLLIGSGSNLLVADTGFDGLVIINKTNGIELDYPKLNVKSGTELQKLVDFANEHGLADLENLTGIPGTVGGAVFGNAGAYGQIISDKLTRVKIFDGQKEKWLSKKDCQFEYRESLFKKTKWPILEIEFALDKGSVTQLKAKSGAILEKRLKAYKPGLLSAGSFFKNVLVDHLSKEVLAKIPPEKITYGKIPAAYLLESVGAKGAKSGKIKISDNYANLFINLGSGKAKDFYELAHQFWLKVKKKYGLVLEPEVQLIGFVSRQGFEP